MPRYFLDGSCVASSPDSRESGDEASSCGCACIMSHTSFRHLRHVILTIQAQVAIIITSNWLTHVLLFE